MIFCVCVNLISRQNQTEFYIKKIYLFIYLAITPTYTFLRKPKLSFGNKLLSNLVRKLKKSLKLKDKKKTKLQNKEKKRDLVSVFSKIYSSHTSQMLFKAEIIIKDKESATK